MKQNRSFFLLHDMWYVLRNKIKLGFTLIEVVVFVTILGLFFVAASAVSVATIRNMKANEHKILATRYAEELVEWLRSQRGADWEVFSSDVATCSDSATKFKCFSTLDWTSGECSTTTTCTSKINGLFDRTAKFSTGNPGEINVSVNVAWVEPGGNFSVPISTVFTLNEQ